MHLRLLGSLTLLWWLTLLRWLGTLTLLWWLGAFASLRWLGACALLWLATLAGICYLEAGQFQLSSCFCQLSLCCRLFLFSLFSSLLVLCHTLLCVLALQLPGRPAGCLHWGPVMRRGRSQVMCMCRGRSHCT